MSNLSPEQQTRIIESTTREIVERYIQPVVQQEVRHLASKQMMDWIQKLIRQQTNRPWRWHFKIGGVEVALRRYKR